MILELPDEFVGEMPCPECGEDLLYDTRSPREANCEHCHWSAVDMEPDPDASRGDEWDAPIPADWP